MKTTKMGVKKTNDQFSDRETALRRDEVIRRMANTPPQPKATSRPKKKTTTALGSAARKAAPARKKS
jgi:hypothetical protein